MNLIILTHPLNVISCIYAICKLTLTPPQGQLPPNQNQQTSFFQTRTFMAFAFIQYSIPIAKKYLPQTWR